MVVPRVVERRIVTVMFADLVGFTALSERLDAEDVADVQDAYFEAVREAVARHGGLLEKFIGDAAMAVFGAPRVRDDDAERAVRTGLALVAAVDRLGGRLGLEEDALRLRVGVNTGEAVYGEATNERGPVTGDTVNVAARLQAAAAPGTVVVGELTALAAADAVVIERLEPLELKGKSERVAAFRVVGLHEQRLRDHALGALRAPTLGREEMLARLSAAADGKPRLIALVAPPGVGKTRLVDELARRIAGTTRVFRSRLRPDILSPFEPVGQLVRSVAAPEELNARIRAAGVAAARADVVTDALSALVAPLASDGVHADRASLFQTWLDGLDALAHGDSVWLVEDVHWASADLLSFLRFAATTPSERGRLVVATARPSFLDVAGAWDGAAEVVELPPLEQTDTAALVAALVGDALPPELVERVASASAGNALFVEELLRSWVSSATLVLDGARWSLRVAPEDVSLPQTVQAIYAGQLDDLPDAARDAARRASIAGRRFPTRSFEALGIAEGHASVGTLVRRAFVAGPLNDPTLGESYVYRHALLRDAAYATLSRRDRAVLHLRLADWLASAEPAALPTLAEVIARHYAAALAAAPSLARTVDGRTRDDLVQLAADWFERAASVAVSFAAWESAHALASQALELTPASDEAGRARRLQQLGEVTVDAVGADVAESVLRDALAAYRALGGEGRAGLASTAAALGDVLRSQTRFSEAGDLADATLVEIGDGDPAAQARLLLVRGTARLNADDAYDAAAADAHRAAALIDERAEPLLALQATQLLAQIDAESGRLDEATWLTVERLARVNRRWDDAAGAVRVRAGIHLDDDPELALPILEEAAALARDHALVEGLAWCEYARAEALFGLGDWDAALDAGFRALATGEARGFQRVIVRTWFVLLPIAEARGRHDLVRQAHPWFEWRDGREPDSPYARVIATAAHLRFAHSGLEHFAVPDVESRLPSFRLAHGGPSWLAGVMTVVEEWLGQGDLDSAALALDTMRETLARVPSSGLAFATEAVLRSRLELARADCAAAAAAASEALASTQAPWWRLRAAELVEAAGGASREITAEADALARRLNVTRRR
jgi:class 3 adenylate cyclase/tetratricopeptide (TPR) repeat protein